MKRAYYNCFLLDGTEKMEPTAHKMVLTDGGKVLAPRILAANEGISVPGGHMAGSVAAAAKNNEEALAQLHKAKGQGVDLVKLMITGGVLDAQTKGTPGELKMPAGMVKAVCDEAHKLGYTVAAHTESPQGVRVALENGVDSIVTARNPLDDLTALRQLELVVCRGRMVKHPRPKRKPEIDAALDPYLK